MLHHALFGLSGAVAPIPSILNLGNFLEVKVLNSWVL